jgi:hypothetical protein
MAIRNQRIRSPSRRSAKISSKTRAPQERIEEAEEARDREEGDRGSRVFGDESGVEVVAMAASLAPITYDL